MKKFREEGRYSFDHFDISGFSSVSASDKEIPDLIQSVKQEYRLPGGPTHGLCIQRFKSREKKR
jgi:hypothetical protein